MINQNGYRCVDSSCSYLTLKAEKLLKFQVSVDGLQVTAESGPKPVANHFQYLTKLAVCPGPCRAFGFGCKSAKLASGTKDPSPFQARRKTFSGPKFKLPLQCKNTKGCQQSQCLVCPSWTVVVEWRCNVASCVGADQLSFVDVKGSCSADENTTILSFR